MKTTVKDLTPEKHIGRRCAKDGFTGTLQLAYRNEGPPVWMILRSDTEWLDLKPTDEVEIKP